MIHGTEGTAELLGPGDIHWPYRFGGYMPFQLKGEGFPRLENPNDGRRSHLLGVQWKMNDNAVNQI